MLNRVFIHAEIMRLHLPVSSLSFIPKMAASIEVSQSEKSSRDEYSLSHLLPPPRRFQPHSFPYTYILFSSILIDFLYLPTDQPGDKAEGIQHHRRGKEFFGTG